ncbi:MAG: Ig-like domain-containing protein [Turneriella sp.]
MSVKINILLLSAMLATLLMPACKLNKDLNCDNPKASCFKKDTEAPTISATSPASAAIGGTTTPAQSSLASVTVTFSEPMKNADDVKNYPKPTGPGAAALNVVSITKIDDRSYTINLSGNVGGGAVDFDLRALMDLSGNALSNGQFTITTTSIDRSSDYVSTGGYTTVTAVWKNTNNVTVAYQFKKGGTSCTAGATDITAGTNLSGPGAGIYDSGTDSPKYTTTINETEITSNPTTIRLCLTNAGAGLQTEQTFDLFRDNSPPTLNTLTADTVVRPYTITLTCTDNLDKIAYTTNGTAPTFSASGAITNGTQYVVATGYALPMGTTQFTYRCIDRAGNVTAASATYTFRSAFTWDQSNWSASGPTPPYDVWK